MITDARGRAGSSVSRRLHLQPLNRSPVSSLEVGHRSCISRCRAVGVTLIGTLRARPPSSHVNVQLRSSCQTLIHNNLQQHCYKLLSVTRCCIRFTIECFTACYKLKSQSQGGGGGGKRLMGFIWEEGK